MKDKKNKIHNQIQRNVTLKNVSLLLNRFLFVYAFISFLFWFLNCFEIDWLYHFNPLFAIPYSIIKNFYVPHGVGVDFTVAIIGGLSLMLGFIFDIISNKLQQIIYDLQEKEDELIIQIKQEKSRKMKKPVSQQLLNNYYDGNIQNSKFVCLVTPNIIRLISKKGEIELTFQNVELWKQRVNKRLIDNISYSKPMQKGLFKNNLFIVYKDFSYVDEFILHLNPTFHSIINEFHKYGVTMTLSCVLSAVPEVSYLEKELDSMDTVLSLEFEDDNIIITGKFKNVYDTKTNKKHLLKYKGEYNLSKNLTISNRQPLYILSKKVQKEEKQ